MKPSDYTLLVAEDEKASLFLYSEVLTAEGYRVLTAENGLQVLGQLEDQKVDLLMTDVKMPDMHAFEMVPKVRAEFPDLPIIVVSAFKGMQDDFHLNGYNIAAFLSKPVPIALLKETIRGVLDKLNPVGRV